MKIRSLIIIAGGIGLCTCAAPPSLLEEVQSTGVLRVVTRNSPVSWYQGPRGPEGLEYELAAGFARWLGVELELHEAHRFSDLLGEVERGRMHLAAAGLTVTPERASRVDFGPVYQQVDQHVVYRKFRKRPGDAGDLEGGLEVVAQSSYVHTLTEARAEFPDLAWTEDGWRDAGELLARVAGGEANYTIVDSNLFSVFRRFYPELKVAFNIRSGDGLAWAFPPRRGEELVEEARRYFEHLHVSGEMAHVMERYYGHSTFFDYAGTRKFIADVDRLLPRYRKAFESAAERADMDWRLLAAIGYQESHWNPKATSPRGAVGMMMLIPSTSDMVNVSNPLNADQNILGGAKYFWRMRQRVDKLAPEARVRDRNWMALAAYNMGYGHLLDARRITEMNGGNPDRWIDLQANLPLLMERVWYSQVRWGYAHSRETLAYVRNIRNYYDILVWLTDERPEPELPAEPGASPVVLTAL